MSAVLEIAGRAGTNEDVITAIAADGSFYPIGKLAAHVRPVLHLAISIFIFDGDRLVVQQRAANKYHAPGQWSNTCCSHPRWDERPEDCASRRLYEELGMSAPLRRIGKLQYCADVLPLYENEYVHCFAGNAKWSDFAGRFNRAEVMAIDRCRLVDLRTAIRADPERFTPWFRIYLERHYDMLARFADDAVHPASAE